MIRLGFEPKTHSLEGCCSIQLSYRTNPWLLVGQVVLLVPKVAAKIDIIFVFAISGCCKSWVLVDFNWVWVVFWLGFIACCATSLTSAGHHQPKQKRLLLAQRPFFVPRLRLRKQAFDASPENEKSATVEVALLLWL